MEAEQVVLPQRTTTTYTVLCRAIDGGGGWKQVKSVELQSRQHRKGAIPLALEGGAGFEGSEYLVLDEAAAQVYRLKRRPKPSVAEEFEVVAI